jgi:hypothetical protein
MIFVYFQRPRSQEGFTQIIANDKGHLKAGVARSLESPWGNFVGTWDRRCHMIGKNMIIVKILLNQESKQNISQILFFLFVGLQFLHFLVFLKNRKKKKFEIEIFPPL